MTPIITNAILLLVAGVATMTLLFAPAFRRSEAWRATVVPLSSIMGSGYLVSAPLLLGLVGWGAAPAMAGLLLAAWLVGAAVRYNIANEALITDPSSTPRGDAHRLERGHYRCAKDARTRASTERRWVARAEGASHVVLAAAYVISVSYYLQLLAAFVLPSDDPTTAKLAVTAILATLGLIGAAGGLGFFERIEGFAAAVNLALVVTLLVGLVIYVATHFGSATLSWPELEGDATETTRARQILGLLIVVQGFETSRFLGSEHSAALRIMTMKRAQGIATVVYLAFLCLATVAVALGASLEGGGVTAILGLATAVTPLLGILVTVAAVGSQFSAAVADDAGCAGLVQAMWRGARPWQSYALIAAASIALTWMTDVFLVIALASRGFALFYTLQCLVAAGTAHGKGERWKALGFGALSILTVSVTVFGLSAE